MRSAIEDAIGVASIVPASCWPYGGREPGQSPTGHVGDMHGSAIVGLADFLAANGLVHKQEEFDPRSLATTTFAAKEQEALMGRLGHLSWLTMIRKRKFDAAGAESAEVEIADDVLRVVISAGNSHRSALS